MSSQKAPSPQQPPGNLYSQVLHYRHYTQTADHANHHRQLLNFLQYEIHKVMFIFGPSGSGKHMFVDNFMRRMALRGLRYEYKKEELVRAEAGEGYGEDLGNGRRFKGIRELISESIAREQVSQVEIYEQFPIPNSETTSKEIEAIRVFRNSFFNKVVASKAKLIFILNSDIYNSYYILPRDRPEAVVELTFRPYGIKQVKNIVKQFVVKHPVFEWVTRSKETMEQIIEISSGDMRKVLLNLYKHTLSDQSHRLKGMSKEEKSQHKFRLKNEQRFPLFHMLGKFLHAKRLDPTTKKDRVFTRDELDRMDPPFYFDPVDMYNRSTTPLSTFTDLLFENYLVKIADIADAVKISQMFTFLDANFPSFITNKRVDALNQDTQKQYVFLLTWGIILKNKSSSQIGKVFTSFRKSEQSHVCKEMNTKSQLLRKYFPYNSISSLVRWGFIVRKMAPVRPYLIKNIIKHRSRMINIIRDENEKTISTIEEEQVAQQQFGNPYAQFLQSYQKKKRLKESEMDMLKECMEDDDASDID